MEFIDTHAHLDFEYEDGITPQQIVKEAFDNHVTKIITIGSDPKSLKKIRDIADSFENVYYSLGIHPHEAKDFNSDIEREILTLKDKKCVAIGEIGLDFFYEHSPRGVQKRVFVKQINMAQELGLPVIIHIRDADAESYDILKNEFKDFCNGVVHCYSGTKEQLKKYLDLGMSVSFTGIITFNKSLNVQEAAAYSPKERIMLETDAPFLAPVPYRGKKNYPKYIPLIAKKLSELRKETIEQVAEYTTSNAVKFFSLN
ncbi:MAG: TatD family hydrolase [Proteobacteria bacterium]|nr:TatD family hydrolase [Pseudomonadota bacterium]